jgi:hypothetical protein
LSSPLITPPFRTRSVSVFWPGARGGKQATRDYECEQRYDNTGPRSPGDRGPIRPPTDSPARSLRRAPRLTPVQAGVIAGAR